MGNSLIKIRFAKSPNDGGFVVADGEITGTSGIFYKLLGYSQKEIVGRPIGCIMSPKSRYRLKARLNGDNGTGPFDLEFIRKDGSIIFERIMAERITGSNRDEIQSQAVKLTLKAKAEEDVRATEKDIVENEQPSILDNIQANIDRIALPALERLEVTLNDDQVSLLEVVKDCLLDLASPLTVRLAQTKTRLSPREIEICQMLANGLSSREIALNLNVSEQTVLTQRRNIRRKLMLTNEKTNLAQYLKNLSNSRTNSN